MTENISRIVFAALDATPPPYAEPVSITVTYLMRTNAELDGASFDDIYPNVMAWRLAHDRKVTDK